MIIYDGSLTSQSTFPFPLSPVVEESSMISISGLTCLAYCFAFLNVKIGDKEGDRFLSEIITFDALLKHVRILQRFVLSPLSDGKERLPCIILSKVESCRSKQDCRHFR